MRGIKGSPTTRIRTTFEALTAPGGADGIVCGPIHKAEMRRLQDIFFHNDGDWAESCAALVEHADGRLEILNWAEIRSLSMIESA